MATKKSDTKSKVKAAFHETKKNPPRVLGKTKKKSGAAQANKQRIAIALNKARAAGAKVPEAPSRQQVIDRIKQRSQSA